MLHGIVVCSLDTLWGWKLERTIKQDSRRRRVACYEHYHRHCLVEHCNGRCVVWSLMRGRETDVAATHALCDSRPVAWVAHTMSPDEEVCLTCYALTPLFCTV